MSTRPSARRRTPQGPQPTASTLHWLRGTSTWLKDDHIYCDCRHPTTYAPLADRTIGLELSAVTTADDALKFAHWFGLLETTGITAAGTEAVHEPVSLFTQAAADLRLLIETVRDIRRAAAGDHKEALPRLRWRFGMGVDRRTKAATIAAPPRFGTRPRPEGDAAWAELLTRHRVDLDGHEAVLWCDEWMAISLQQLQAGTPSAYSRALMGEPVRPGRYRLGAAPETLLSACALSFAFLIAEEVPLDLCAECEGAFLPADARQRFCTPACASRARFRRFTTRQQQRGTPTERRRDKATRTRRR